MSKGADTSEAEVRAGSRALALLAVPLNGMILQQLADRPMRLAELQRSQRSAPQSTVRAHLRALEETRVIARRSAKGSPGLVDFALRPAGRELLEVAGALERWLLLCPARALAFGSAEGKSAIKALAGGWSAMVVGTLARGPCSLSDLDRGIAAVTYPTLSRRVGELRRVGQIETCAGEGPGSFYEPTRWLREAVAPLAAAVRWERAHFPADSVPVARFDVEAALLLALPLLVLEETLAGSCRLEVEVRDGEGPLCGAFAVIEAGRAVSCLAGALGAADAWAGGPGTAWAEAMAGGGLAQLELGGEEALARAVLEGLRGALFGGAAEGAAVT